MNRYIITIGLACSLLWGFVTLMTFGLPEQVIHWVQKITFHQFSGEVSRMANGFYYDVRNNDMPTATFLIVFCVIFILVTILTCLMAAKKPKKYSLGLIVMFSVLFHLILLPGELIHENDIYRYLWDGKTSLQGINPYKYAPADVFMVENGHTEDFYDDFHEVTIRFKSFTSDDKNNLDELIILRDEKVELYERIGHWQVPTIYPPTAQVLFALPAMVNRYSIVLMKFFHILFNVANLFLIIALLNHFKKNPCMSIIYGWSPLVLFEYANRGHYDPIPIFFTLLAIFLYFKGRQWGGALILAVATLAKFFSGVLLPILMRPFKMRYLLFFGIVFIGAYLPYILWDQTGVKGVFEGLMTYNLKWSYNSSFFAMIYLILEKFFPSMTATLIPSKIIAGCCYLIFLAWLTFTKNKSDLDRLHKCFLAIAALFIINPVADPWYFCWAMPFLCFFPYKSWYVLSGMLILSYLNFRSDLAIVDLEYWGISLIGWIIYIPFFVLMISELIVRPKFTAELDKKPG